MNHSEFDVFLSFRGSDTRNSFTGHLYERLNLHGVSTFIDSESSHKGKRIEEVLKYIERSKVCIAIISEGYADSKWCLREIAKMVELGKLIIPVFFKVEPSDVRNQSGTFEKAFNLYKRHRSMEEISKWRNALKNVGGISGYNLKDMGGHESKLIQFIVKDVLNKVNTSLLNVAVHPVGLGSRIADLEKLLGIKLNDPQMVGIHGMGGIGKTTLAKSIYNKIFSSFEAWSFISGVREKSKLPNGLESLQEQLLKDIIKDMDVRITDSSNGIEMIKQKIRCKKVLVVPDDVDNKEQLDALAGELNWFSEGSRVIITTRNYDVLNAHGIEKIYSVEGLNLDHSMHLFSYHAFRKDRPPKKYEELTKEVLSTAEGLPLALEVFGSQFFDMEGEEEWKDLLKKLKRYHSKEVHDRLRISYDKLDKSTQDVFLDIACFCIGMDRELPIPMWEDCGLHPYLAIKDLLHKCLIKISKDMESFDYIGKEKEIFEMHDQIRDMGRTIVREKYSEGRCSRLWGGTETLEDLRKLQEPGSVEGIMLTATKNEGAISATCFKEMSNRLRFFHVEKAHFEGRFQHFPTDLKWLSFRACHFEHPPTEFNLKDITLLDLFSCNSISRPFVEQQRGKKLGKLRILDLSRTDITRTPDFRSTPCLEKLMFRLCKELTTVCDNVGELKQLAILDLTECCSLQRIPEAICQLCSLKSLILKRCKQVSSLPNRLGDITSLEVLVLDKTRLKTLPDSVGELRRLRLLSLEHCSTLELLPDTTRNLCSLEKFSVLGTGLRGLVCDSSLDLMHLNKITITSCEVLRVLPDSSIKRIRSLTVRDSSIDCLPEFIGSLKKVTELKLYCIKLKSLPDTIDRLQELECFEVRSNILKFLPESIGSMRKVKRLRLDCLKLVALPDTIGELQKLEYFEVRSHSLEYLPESIGSMWKLKRLRLDCLKLVALPDIIIGGLQELECFEVRSSILNFLPGSIVSLVKVKEFKLQCFKLKVLPNSIDSLGGVLVKLSLDDCRDLGELPSSMHRLHCLQTLHISGCSSLSSLPDLPPSLEELAVTSCCDLNTVSDVSNLTSLKVLRVGGCWQLVDVPGLENIAHILEILSLPGPIGTLWCSSLGDGFRTRVQS